LRRIDGDSSDTAVPYDAAMATRAAECHCGQLRLEATGEPIRISVCHCLACQRRTGTAFAVQARFPAARVRVTGRFRDHVRHSDESGEARTFHFCPDCGSTVFYETGHAPGVIAVPVGAFADPAFPPPRVSVFESRRHPWVAMPDAVERPELLWEPLRPLYEAGAYAEAADRGRALLEAHPDAGELLYNVACCESLAGRTADALEHLRRAIERADDVRGLAAGDSDLAPLRAEPAFEALVGER
jgi:hypothetical protein